MQRPVFQAVRLQFGVPQFLNLIGFMFLFINEKIACFFFVGWALYMTIQAVSHTNWEQAFGFLGIGAGSSTPWLPVHCWELTVATYVALVSGLLLAYPDLVRRRTKPI